MARSRATGYENGWTLWIVSVVFRSVKNELVSYDESNKILVLKGAVPGYNGAFGKIRIAK